jgi:hypothetical protein
MGKQIAKLRLFKGSVGIVDDECEPFDRKNGEPHGIQVVSIDKHPVSIGCGMILKSWTIGISWIHNPLAALGKRLTRNH